MAMELFSHVEGGMKGDRQKGSFEFAEVLLYEY